MYYIINITSNTDKEITNYIGETYMFPILCRVDDIISGHLGLEDKCCQNLTKMYSNLFEKAECDKITTVIDICIGNIIEAHSNKPVIGIFNKGKYDEKLTLTAEDFSSLKGKFEPLTKECKI